MSSPRLYDEIASVYHLIYADWEASIERQAQQLDELIQDALGGGAVSILDASCGIGTQSLGLARRGHRVTASDLSRAAVARARDEAHARGLSIAFGVGDMRDCHERFASPFDVVLSADNSVPHLLTDDDLLAAFRSFHACTRPGGLCLVTVRDYATEDDAPTQLRPYGIRAMETGRCIVLQAWDFVDAERYDVTMYFVHEVDGEVVGVTTGRSRYRAVTTDHLLALLAQAGFEGARRIDDRFFQPVLLARRPSG